MVKSIKHNFEILKVGMEIIATSSTFFLLGNISTSACTSWIVTSF